MNSTPARIAQVVFLVAAVAAVMVFASVVQDAERRRSPEHLVQLLNPNYVGDNRLAPDFDLVDRHGEHHHLRDYRGKTVVLHFWTRTCEPCVDELQRTIPTFDEIITARDDIVLLMVTVDSNWEAISPLVPPSLQAAKILFDPERRIVRGKYGTRLFPETFVIDPRGVIRARFDHSIDWTSPVLLNFLGSLR